MLIVCPSCFRHLRVSAATCPFCCRPKLPWAFLALGGLLACPSHSNSGAADSQSAIAVSASATDSEASVKPSVQGAAASVASASNSGGTDLIGLESVGSFVYGSPRLAGSQMAQVRIDTEVTVLAGQASDTQTTSIRRGFRALSTELSQCLATARKAQPNLAGQVVLKVVLDSRGPTSIHVDDAKSTAKDQALANCVVGAVWNAQFLPHDLSAVTVEAVFSLGKLKP